MTTTDLAPATARDALITELLSDVGHVHDAIKGLPKLLELSMNDSLLIVANAVDDSEKTALLLQQSTHELMRAASSKVGIDVGMELATAIHQSLEKVFEPALQRASTRIGELEKKVTSMSASTRDVHATRLNQILLVGFVALSLVTIGVLGWAALKTQDVNETNKWFYQEYKDQRSVIDTLPADIKQRFKK
ncbi:hypothetical protein ACLIN3_27595 (plasmid) [Pseudomonas orientalis]|uniref:hypothetical protein n=1 Tax=Pseudomonas orientalis TaxID=76758 RepID=UPI003988394F